MANETTVPLLPCRDIDDLVEFYSILGFTRTYYQALPNPYVALKREDINSAHQRGILKARVATW